MSTAVRDNPAENRYEIHEAERLAGFSAYRLTGRRIAFTHTETLPEFRGRGLAGRLVAGGLDDARRRGLAVLPFCPYVREYIAEHADAHLDLVPARDRARFGLPHPETA
ncbi:N-acetyltransferase [Streptomyces sp. S07_1.15]|uniref:GNAT family N-acetyltransferase n=1 Tax=Streptomyces sp. S07_1.15 TaxID=2873925 RepID=UPI001D15600E|nr:GNAT family N-acetyltransferase [Streptomyces sp. S07_1.15]MCC3655364.1 N-acetyltransferase [Streptomyces sp. S07_1.15]